MSKRKSSGKKESEFIDKVIGLSSVGLFFLCYMLTHSFRLSLSFGIAGFLISIAYLINRKISINKKIKNSKIHEIDSMTGTQFEYFLKLIYIQQGYKVETTKVTGDFGADLVMRAGDRRIVVQAKRYNTRVGIKAIQEVVSSIAYYKAHEGWVVTNNEFTAAAMELAKSNGVKLIERNQLINMITGFNKEKEIAVSIEEIKTDVKEVLCEKCGSVMVARNGKRGAFMGCSSFPKCRHTKPL